MTLMEWAKDNWLKIVIGIVVLIIIFGIVKTVNQLLNCSGPVCKGIGGVLGAAATVLNTLTSGCSSQADCSKLTDSDSCGKGNGCSWSSKATSGTCVSTTGLKPGEGGFLTPSCGLGMGLLAFLVASLLGSIITAIVSRTGVKSENAKTVSEKTGKPINEVVTDLADNAKERIGEALPILDEKLGTAAPEAVVEALAGHATSNLAATEAVKASLGQTQETPAQRQQNVTNAVEFQGQEQARIDLAADKSGVSPGESDAAKGAADEVCAPAAVETISRIQAFQSINRVPSKNAHALLTRHVYHHMRKGEHIPPQHIAFLKSVEPK